MAETKAEGSEAAAFFRWQEWVAYRRLATPVAELTRADLYLAEARVLADASEPEAAREAAGLAREHYKACESNDAIRAKLKEIEEFLEHLARAGEETDPIADEQAVVSLAEIEREIQALEGLLDTLKGEDALRLLKRVNVLAGSTPVTGGYPFRMKPTFVKVSLRSPATLETKSLVAAMSTLRMVDPFRFGIVLQMLQAKSGADFQSDKLLADWLKGDEVG